MKKTVIISCLFFVSFLTSQTIYSQSIKPDSVLINELISKKRSFNKEFGYGFRIQLYNGLETEAKKTETNNEFELNPTLRESSILFNGMFTSTEILAGILCKSTNSEFKK